jgi:hypothetical protein
LFFPQIHSIYASCLVIVAHVVIELLCVGIGSLHVVIDFQHPSSIVHQLIRQLSYTFLLTGFTKHDQNCDPFTSYRFVKPLNDLPLFAAPMWLSIFNSYYLPFPFRQRITSTWSYLDFVHFQSPAFFSLLRSFLNSDVFIFRSSFLFCMRFFIFFFMSSFSSVKTSSLFANFFSISYLRTPF